MGTNMLNVHCTYCYRDLNKSNLANNNLSKFKQIYINIYIHICSPKNLAVDI